MDPGGPDEASFRVGRRLDKIGLHVQDTAELSSPICGVPAANLLGENGAGFGYVMSQLARNGCCRPIARRPLRDPRAHHSHVRRRMWAGLPGRHPRRLSGVHGQGARHRSAGRSARPLPATVRWLRIHARAEPLSFHGRARTLWRQVAEVALLVTWPEFAHHIGELSNHVGFGGCLPHERISERAHVGDR